MSQTAEKPAPETKPPRKKPKSKPAPTPESTSILDRTVANLRDLWRGIAGSADAGDTRLGPADAKRLREQILACLEARGGEVTGRARAAALGHEYLGLSAPDRKMFLRILADEFGLDTSRVAGAAKKLLGAQTDTAKDAAIADLRAGLVAPRVQLLTQFNALPDGVKFLVDMRAEVLAHARKEPLFRGLLDDLTSLLTSWFDIGFLELRRITWDAPASLLEKLIAYEAVHEISNWDDLKNRLSADRRCFGYFHPGMPEEPLIFVEVALVDAMSDNIGDLLDTDAPTDDPGAARAAIFYSISNAQAGLAGISFGNFLIKRVVAELAQEFPNLKTFATLSPVPAFRDWFREQPVESLVSDTELKHLPGHRDEDFHPADILKRGTWRSHAQVVKTMKPVLLRAMARFLTNAPGVAAEEEGGGRVIDPVAHFHLSNGARLERLNWMADPSPKGLRQSVGIMVNYLYDPARIDANHEAYTGDGKVTSASAVRSLAK